MGWGVCGGSCPLSERPIVGTVTVVHAQFLDGVMLIVLVFQQELAVALGKRSRVEQVAAPVADVVRQVVRVASRRWRVHEVAVYSCHTGVHRGSRDAQGHLVIAALLRPGRVLA